MDGLTVPFVLTASLLSLETSKLVVYGGIAELISGIISMGVSGFCESKYKSYAIFPCSNPYI